MSHQQRDSLFQLNFQCASQTNLDQLSIRIPCEPYRGFQTGRTGSRRNGIGA